MTDEKQIEEMAQDIRAIKEFQASDVYTANYQEARCLFSLGYRKLPKGAVVFTEEEQDNIISENAKFLREKFTEIRENTAREIAKFVSEHCDDESLMWVLDEFIAKQYGIEVDDND